MVRKIKLVDVYSQEAEPTNEPRDEEPVEVKIDVSYQSCN